MKRRPDAARRWTRSRRSRPGRRCRRGARAAAAYLVRGAITATLSRHWWVSLGKKSCDSDWAASAMTGLRSSIDVATPVDRLVMPGPSVAKQACGRLVRRDRTSAMMPALNSWRVRTKSMPSTSSKRIEAASRPDDAEDALDAVVAQTGEHGLGRGVCHGVLLGLVGVLARAVAAQGTWTLWRCPVTTSHTCGRGRGQCFGSHAHTPAPVGHRAARATTTGTPTTPGTRPTSLRHRGVRRAAVSVRPARRSRTSRRRR